LEIAKQVSRSIDAEILVQESNDPRSYRQDSEKLIKTGFKPSYKISDAIEEIKINFQKGLIDGSDSQYTVKWMKKLGLSES
jgi:hypothetical protein